jgi:hypothetical protein
MTGAVGGASRAAQIVGEAMLLRFAVHRVGDPEDRGGVDGHWLGRSWMRRFPPLRSFVHLKCFTALVT